MLNSPDEKLNIFFWSQVHMNIMWNKMVKLIYFMVFEKFSKIGTNLSTYDHPYEIIGPVADIVHFFECILIPEVIETCGRVYIFNNQ